MVFVSFVAGLIFGVGSGVFEKLIAQPLRKYMPFSDSEVTILSFGSLMLVASIVVSAMRVDSSAFWLVLGGLLGAFAIRGFLFSKTKVAEKKALRDAAREAENMADDAIDTAKDAVDTALDKAKDVADSASDAIEGTAKKAMS